jgi:hypothetical protein
LPTEDQNKIIGLVGDAHSTRFGEGMDPSIHRALALLGDPDRVRAPVHTPQLEGLDGPELERETYKWFEANEGRRQYLTALDLDEGLFDLQTLER